MANVRRILILAVTLAVTLAMVATASAKPPKCDIEENAPGCGGTEPEDPEAVLWDLTLEFIGDADGLATDCPAGAVAMEYSPPGRPGGWLSPTGPNDSTETIEIDVRDLDATPFVYTRSLGDPGEHVGLNGCHGPPLDFAGNESTKPGHIMIEATDATISLMWFLDWYETTVPHPHAPKTVNAWEHLYLSNPGFDAQPMTVFHPDSWPDLQPGWKVEDGGARSAIVSGPFDLWADGQDGLLDPPPLLTFLITLTPRG